MNTSTALLLTSTQFDLLHPQGGAWSLVESTVTANAVVKNIGRLAATARKMKIPVFYSPIAIDYGDPALASMKAPSAIHQLVLSNQLLGMGGRGAEFLPELAPQAGDIVLSPRSGFSSFWSNDIDRRLQACGVRQLYIAGMLAHACVESHARDAVEKGYQPIIVKDAIGAASQDLLDAVLKIMALQAHEILDTATATNRWLGAS
jgi:nicotinamidase-related amidase